MAEFKFSLAFFVQLSSSLTYLSSQKSELMLRLSWKGNRKKLKQNKTKKNKLKEDVP
jgi:hypothetical protein